MPATPANTRRAVGTMKVISLSANDDGTVTVGAVPTAGGLKGPARPAPMVPTGGTTPAQTFSMPAADAPALGELLDFSYVLGK